MTASTIAYVVFVVFLATTVRSTLGFGEALVAVPLLALRIPVAVAAPFVVAVSVLVAGANLAADWRHVELRSARGLVLSALVGVPGGVLLLRYVDDRAVKVALGVTIIGLSIYSLVRRPQTQPRAGGSAWLVLTGVISGILGGAYGMNGPPLAIYGALRGWTPVQFRATLQGYFLVASVAGLIGYAAIGIWTAASTQYLVLSLPAVIGGFVVARLLVRRTDGPRFFRVVYGGLLVIGAVLIGQALFR